MNTLEGIPLPSSLQWSDEYSSSKVTQTMKRTLDGGVVVYYGPNMAGLPITLESTSESGWVQKSVLDQLHTIANSPGGIYTLSLRGVSYQVMFRHQDGVALEAAPLIPVNSPGATDYYTVKIRLMTV